MDARIRVTIFLVGGLWEEYPCLASEVICAPLADIKNVVVKF